MIQVENNPHLLRDVNSKGIINTDISALNEHRNRRKLMENVVVVNQEINTIKSQVNNITQDLTDIKQLLALLTQKWA